MRGKGKESPKTRDTPEPLPSPVWGDQNALRTGLQELKKKQNVARAHAGQWSSGASIPVPLANSLQLLSRCEASDLPIDLLPRSLATPLGVGRINHFCSMVW